MCQGQGGSHILVCVEPSGKASWRRGLVKAHILHALPAARPMVTKGSWVGLVRKAVARTSQTWKAWPASSPFPRPTATQRRLTLLFPPSRGWQASCAFLQCCAGAQGFAHAKQVAPSPGRARRPRAPRLCLPLLAEAAPSKR